MQRALLRFLLVSMAVILAGCAHPMQLGKVNTKQKFVYLSPEKRVAKLSQVNHWRLYGAFSVEVNNKTKILNFDWYQRSRKMFIVKLSSPGDFYQLMLKFYHGVFTFWKTPTRYVQAKSFKNLMLSELGWYLPFDDFYFWVRGLPLTGKYSHGKVIKKYDKYGHLIVLGQNGYVIHYRRFVNYRGYDMPTMMDVFGKHIKVRIAIKDWIFYFARDMLGRDNINRMATDILSRTSRTL